MLSLARPGCRAEVELRNKKYAGIIKQIHENKPEAFEPKDVLNILDMEPVIFSQQLHLWEWIAGYYLCSEGEVMAAALPAHFKLSSETVLVFNEEFGEDFSQLDHDEYMIAEALAIKKELKVPEAQDILDKLQVYPVIKRLIEKKVCHVWEALKDTYTAKKETFILLNPAFEDEDAMSKLLNEDKKLQRAEKQMELLLSYLHLYKTEGEVSRSALLKKSGASEAQLKGLIDKKILQTEKRNIDRIKYLPRQVKIDFELSAAQESCLQQIRDSFEQKPVCLLHGITSSGKTLIYIRLIEEYIRQGKQVLYLLPEIALTSQIIRRLQKHFGGYIGIYHSKFSQLERIETWNKLRNGELQIVLGVRSSLFLPFGNLGLIIVDEEHDASFKQQDPAPRYHARDAAVFYGTLTGAHTLLGSATPSVESYFNARQGKYGLATLGERFGQLSLPAIEIVDTKKIIQKEKVIISPELQQAIQQSLDVNKQVILFRNRRGYSPYQVCQSCGWIPKCDYCDVSLTFHKLSNRLQCHYCGSTYPPVITCPVCGNARFDQRNFGTEKIEEHLCELFPKARLSRMDIDSIRGKSAHDNLIQLFEQRRTDILVGTQMVVKGLDFEHVDLVGILDADSMLNFADFRVNERAFQLMEQVSGRAGRKGSPGRVLIQAVNTGHPVLAYVQAHDYLKFFDQEIEERRRFFYPPFSRLIHIQFRHKMKDILDAAADIFTLGLKTDFGNFQIGPAYPPVARIRNQYLTDILLKLTKDNKLIHFAKTAILQQSAILQNDRRFRAVDIVVDVDAIG